MENNDCRLQQYAVKATQKTTFASENMIWTGLLLLAFIIYHLIQFTFQKTEALVPLHQMMVPDVFGMLVGAFQNIFITLIYAAAMVVLFLHLSHGIQSFFQTMGWNNDRTQPCITKAGTLAALFFFLGYVAIPLTIIVRILK
jgi:succinate dehydrogenase / fumarate reductase cytochrome b subunit